MIKLRELEGMLNSFSSKNGMKWVKELCPIAEGGTDVVYLIDDQVSIRTQETQGIYCNHNETPSSAVCRYVELSSKLFKKTFALQKEIIQGIATEFGLKAQETEKYFWFNTLADCDVENIAYDIINASHSYNNLI
jgi:hypothetical protein